MKTFTIENETNRIAVYRAAKGAGAVPNSQRFASEAALRKLAADWPSVRLVEIWNGLPGVTQVSKFKDRTAAVARIWKAIQNLAVNEPEAPAESNELIAEIMIPRGTGAEADAAAEDIIDALAPTAPGATATNVARQDAHVAPGARVSGDTATPPEIAPAKAVIDRVACDRLLRIAAETQTAYWSALRELEQTLGFEIDDGDLREATVDELMATAQACPQKSRVRRAAAEGTKAPRENSKTNQVIAMLKRPEGTTVEEIMSAMKWQQHTTRAMLSAGGSLAKKHGLVVTSEKVGDRRVYSIRA